MKDILSRKEISEPGCCDGWSSYSDEVDGECPDCGTPTVVKGL